MGAGLAAIRRLAFDGIWSVGSEESD